MFSAASGHEFVDKLLDERRQLLLDILLDLTIGADRVEDARLTAFQIVHEATLEIDDLVHRHAVQQATHTTENHNHLLFHRERVELRLLQKLGQALASVELLQAGWREQVRSRSNPRSDAAAWGLIKVLPAHPIITVAVGVAATERTKPAVSNGISELQNAGVLTPLTTSSRNRAWEATGLLDLIEELGSGDWPSNPADRSMS